MPSKQTKPIKRYKLKPGPKPKVIKPIVKPVGRESKYQPWMDNVAKALAKEGKKDSDIYKVLGVSEVTGIGYKKKYPSFLKSINDGKAEPIKIAENNLFKLVQGYSAENREKLFVVSDGNNLGSHVERVEVVEHFEPNLRAIEFFLNNKKPRKQFPEDGYGEVIEVNRTMNYSVIPDDIEEKE